MCSIAPRRLFLGILLLAGLSGAALAQDSKPASTTPPPAAQSTPSAAPASAPASPQTTPVASPSQAGPADDPLKRPISDKQKKENTKALKQELSKTYKKWLDEDVVYIISDEERKAFKQLSNDEERDQFIEAFWQRRDPTPDTEENEFREEHYRRIEYANEHFAAGVPGWRTDRGRIYIMYGPADEVDAHPSGGEYQRPMEEGGGETSTYPFEDWRYRYIEGIGQEIIIEFVDSCMCNEYRMTIDRSEKDALLETPNGGATLYEQMGLANKSQRFGNGNENLGPGPDSGMYASQQFNRLEQYAKLNAPPPVKFKDLEEVVSHKINVNLMPFDVLTDFVRVTGDTVLVPVTIQMKNRDITFTNKDGVQRGTVNIFCRVTTLTGKIAQTFEDTVQADIPAELLAKAAESSQIYWKAVPLRPGRYRFDVVVKDVNGDRVGTWSRGIQVPEYPDDRLATSSLILADVMEPVAAKNVGTGSFVIGATKVRPRVPPSDGKPASFKRDQKLNFWMQVYNLGVDDKTHKPSATVEYNVINATTNKPVIHTVESTDQMGNIGDQMTLQKTLSAANLGPGTYRIEIKVDDKISKQTVEPSGTFMIE
ncbi:MAG TPA: GWxTD domain-containing protein [Terriglobales bacterium]